MSLDPAFVFRFRAFTSPLEGSVNFLYADRLGWITTGTGNIADPIGLALAMPWKWPDGSLVSPDDIRAAWDKVNATLTQPKGKEQVGSLAEHGGEAYESMTTIRLDAKGVSALFAQRVASNHALLLQRFPRCESWPWDALCALHSMAWAMGVGRFAVFPHFCAAVNASPADFETAAAQCHMEGTGIDKRNAANALMFKNAAIVAGAPGTYDRTTLFWPTELDDDPYSDDESGDSTPPPAAA